MSNLSAFFITLVVAILCVAAFYLLVKKWAKFHTRLIGKIFKVGYAAALVLSFIGFSAAAYVNFNSYWEDDRLRIPTVFQGIQLGWSKDELYFNKGEPTSTTAASKDKRSFLDYDDNTIVWLKNDHVIGVGLDCVSAYFTKLNGIACRDGIDEIIEKFGESKHIAISNNKLEKIYNYVQYNVAYHLSKASVNQLWLIDSKHFTKGIYFDEPKLATSTPPTEGIQWDDEVMDKKKTYTIEEVMGEVPKPKKTKKETCCQL